MPSRNPFPRPQDLRSASQTLTGLPKLGDHLAERLGFLSDLLATVGTLPKEPLLLWREPGHSARFTIIGQELVVGRNTGRVGLTLPEDDGLSRRHFLIRRASAAWVLEDLNSHNGTAINDAGQRVQQHLLRDGDLILAGNHVFIFLDHGSQQ